MRFKKALQISGLAAMLTASAACSADEKEMSAAMQEYNSHLAEIPTYVTDEIFADITVPKSYCEWVESDQYDSDSHPLRQIADKIDEKIWATGTITTPQYSQMEALAGVNNEIRRKQLYQDLHKEC